MTNLKPDIPRVKCRCGKVFRVGSPGEAAHRKHFPFLCKRREYRKEVIKRHKPNSIKKVAHGEYMGLVTVVAWGQHYTVGFKKDWSDNIAYANSKARSHALSQNNAVVIEGDGSATVYYRALGRVQKTELEGISSRAKTFHNLYKHRQ